MRRKLGKSGIEVSAVGMGCWAIGGPSWRGETPTGWGAVDDDESVRAIHRAVDLGVTFFDTADVYGAGHSERIVGKALSGLRDRVAIATKFSNVFDETTKQVTGSDASPDYIRRACEASLKRLGTDVIDLYQFHDGGYDLERAGEVRETLEGLVAAGKIRAYGWSTDSTERARFFAEGDSCASVQHHLNVLWPAEEMLAVAVECNLAAINRGPLAMGLLTGKYTSGSSLPVDDVRGQRSPSWMKYFKDGKPIPAWLEKVTALREVLTSEGRTPAQGALAWIWACSPQTIPIPGFKNVAQVEQNAGAMTSGALKPAQMAEIDRILER